MFIICVVVKNTRRIARRIARGKQSFLAFNVKEALTRGAIILFPDQKGTNGYDFT
jgi:hypothetical protein